MNIITFNSKFIPEEQPKMMSDIIKYLYENDRYSIPISKRKKMDILSRNYDDFSKGCWCYRKDNYSGDLTNAYIGYISGYVYVYDKNLDRIQLKDIGKGKFYVPWNIIYRIQGIRRLKDEDDMLYTDGDIRRSKYGAVL